MKPIKKGERAKLARRLSKKIINILAVYNISQHDLATDIGIKPNTFSGWANGTNCPKHRDLYDQVMAYLDATYIKQDADQLDLLLSPGVDISKPTLGLTLTGEAATGIVEKPSPLDTQVGGNHYKDSPIQPIEYIEANGLSFLEGCVTKRVTRHDKPTGKGKEDIQKAIHELELILELRYGDSK